MLTGHAWGRASAGGPHLAHLSVADASIRRVRNVSAPGPSSRDDARPDIGHTNTLVDRDAAPYHGLMGIKINDVSRSFGTTRAVDGLTASIPDAAVTGLVGPNGAGKTTLLLMLAGLLAPDSGTIRVAGLDPVTQPQELHRAVGWMPDSFGTWDSLTATEILHTFAALQGLGADDAAARSAEALALVHLSDMAEAPARVLSRGQRQRLGLARALVHHPPVLLLDEPAAGMDPRSRTDLRGLLRELAAAGACVVVSSHVLGELEQMIDDAVFVAHGRVVEPGAQRPRWSLRALDGAALAAWAASRPGVGPVVGGAVLVEAANDAQAAAVLRDAVGAGVEVVSFAPVAGSLEERYLSLEEERR